MTPKPWYIWGIIVGLFYSSGEKIAAVWGVYCRFLSRIRPGFLTMTVVNCTSWLITGLIIGLIGFNALGKPAFTLANKQFQKKNQLSVIFVDRYGTEIGRRGVLRDKYKGDDFPPILIQAALATEDRRFFSHFGIDIRGIIRAVIEDIRTSTMAQGGSSITQQLAKNIYLSPEKTLSRKIMEGFLALWLEAKYSKREILKLYLDAIYLGGGATGVTAASRYYFDKSLNELSLAEVAMLVGLFKAPTKYSPYNNLLAARKRASKVLYNMVEAGFMSEAQIASALENPATPVERLENYSPNYFLDWAFARIKKMVPQKSTILTVKTTIDMKAQRAGENIITAALRQYSDQYNASQAALVAMETDGAVITMIGGWNYGESQFNRAVTALRQPGSSFKPFVFATALERGYKPGSIIYDAPITINGWSPQNYTKRYSGRVSLTTAMARSLNTATVRLGRAVGLRRIAKLTHTLGITSNIRPTPSMPLGTSEVSLLELTGAYASFANEGKLAKPYSVISITDESGKVIYRHHHVDKQIIKPSLTRKLNYMLSQVVTGGTGRRAYIKGIPAAGKTGTTQSYRDAWFIGFTGNIVAGVWFGNDDNSPTNKLTGGSLPALSWQWFMSLAHAGKRLAPIAGVATKPATGIYSTKLALEPSPITTKQQKQNFNEIAITLKSIKQIAQQSINK